MNLHGDTFQQIFSYQSGFWKILFAAPAASAAYVVVLCLIIALAKWLLLGRVKPGIYPLHSLWYVRHWFIGCLMNMSLELLFPLYSSIYLPPWLRLLGAKFGKNVEVSSTLIWWISMKASSWRTPFASVPLKSVKAGCACCR